VPRQIIRLAVCSSFGPAWLAPRLPDFARSHAEIDLELRLYAQDPEQTESVADAIVTALPVKSGFKSIVLFDEELIAVAKPTGKFAFDGQQRLITTNIAPNTLGNDWAEFCAITGIRLEDTITGDWIRCTHYLLALEMAKAGLGIALVPDFLAAESLANGTLVCVDRTRIPSGRTYHLCIKLNRSNEPGLRGLSRWIKLQANRSAMKLLTPSATTK
jgi:LysR family glycine cleavage system transcriptional activator